MISFREADEADIDYLLELRKQTMTPHLINAGIATTDEEHLLRIRYQFEYAQIILWQNAPIGLLKVVKGEDSWEIVQFQITPDFQGKGIGKKVLEKIMTNAQKESKPLTLSVLKQNPAQKLYKKMGFVQTQEDVHSYYMYYNYTS